MSEKKDQDIQRIKELESINLANLHPLHWSTMHHLLSQKLAEISSK